MSHQLKVYDEINPFFLKLFLIIMFLLTFVWLFFPIAIEALTTTMGEIGPDPFSNLTTETCGCSSFKHPIAQHLQMTHAHPLPLTNLKFKASLGKV